MANLNLDLGTIAVPIMLFLFTKSLKQSITERILGESDVTRTVIFGLDNQTSKELSQTLKVIMYEIEMGRINFCEKFNGKQLTKADWLKIQTNCLNNSVHFVLPAQLIPIWQRCTKNLNKFCVNIDWVDMKACLIEAIFEQKIYYIQLYYKERIVEVTENLTKIKSCIHRHAGDIIIKNKRNQFLSIRSNP